MAENGKSADLESIPEAARDMLRHFIETSARPPGESRDAQEELVYSIALKIAATQGRFN